MILDRLYLNNFGVYRGEHSIELTPKSKKAPVILVGGLNGGGKTTILDAIQLVLFGKLAKCSNRGNLAYEEFLKRSVTRGEDPKSGAHIQLDFSIHYEGKKTRFIIVRSWNEAGKRIKEEFSVYRDGDLDDGLTENWLDQVDQFLPVGLAELFFFDGEKIARLAESENSAEMLSTAINTLLGIDLVDRLEKDLQTYEKNIRESAKEELEDSLVESLESESRELSSEAQHLAQNRGQLQVELERLNSRLAKEELEFRKHGGELFAQRKELEASERELVSQGNAIEAEMRMVAGSEAPLALVEKDLGRIQRQAEKENESKKQKLLLDELSKRDRSILKKMKKDEISSLARMTLETLFKTDIENRSKAAETPLVLNLDEAIKASLFSVQAGFFKNVKREISALLKRHSAISDRLSRVRERLEQVPDESAISDQGKALTELRTQAIRKQADANAASEAIEQIERRQSETEHRLRKELESRLNNHTDKNVLVRKLRYAGRARETMAKFRSTVLERKIDQIGTEIFDCFQQLMRKKTLVSGVKVDPKTFEMKLVSAKNQAPLPTERLSAGERQLLAVSTLWGLARVSGRPLPNIIDTPLARLDSKHRTNLVDNYFPNASHQVIILSTDEEINKPYLDKLRKRVGASYELFYSDETESTEIREGYFFS